MMSEFAWTVDINSPSKKLKLIEYASSAINCASILICSDQPLS